MQSTNGEVLFYGNFPFCYLDTSVLFIANASPKRSPRRIKRNLLCCKFATLFSSRLLVFQHDDRSAKTSRSNGLERKFSAPLGWRNAPRVRKAQFLKFLLQIYVIPDKWSPFFS